MQWISVKDQKPEKNCSVLVMHDFFYPAHPMIAWYRQDQDAFCIRPDIFLRVGYHHSIPLDITHWIEIPDAKSCDYNPFSHPADQW